MILSKKERTNSSRRSTKFRSKIKDDWNNFKEG